MKNIEVKDLGSQFVNLLQVLKRYLRVFAAVIIIALFAYITFQIGFLNSAEPSEEAIDEKLLSTKSAKIDKEIIDKITELESSNTEVKTLFQQARENPFQD